MIMPDYAMTIDDHTGLIRIMTDYSELRAHAATNRDRHIAAKRRMLPGRHTWRFICVEIIRRRGIGHISEPDIAKAIHREQRLPPGALMPAGSAHEVPHQPRPEDRPDKLEEAAEIRMHARKDGAGHLPGG